MQRAVITKCLRNAVETSSCQLELILEVEYIFFSFQMFRRTAYHFLKKSSEFRRNKFCIMNCKVKEFNLTMELREFVTDLKFLCFRF